MAITRSYIFKNGTAYDIYGTIVALLARNPNDAVIQCVHNLVDMQYTAGLEDFLFDLDDTHVVDGNYPLVYLDIWLQRYGVEVNLDLHSSDLDSTDEDDIDTIDLDGIQVDDDDDSYFSDDEMVAVAELLNIRGPNLMVMRTAHTMRNDIPPHIAFMEDIEETIEDEPEIIDVDEPEIIVIE